MKKDFSNNKGFSLVELIIVIAIMAVLVGLVSVQYVKYVNNSKLSVDIRNAEALATEFNCAFAEEVIPAGTYTSVPSGMSLSALPEVRWNKNLSWTIVVAPSGVTTVHIGPDQIFPDPVQYLAHKQ